MFLSHQQRQIVSRTCFLAFLTLLTAFVYAGSAWAADPVILTFTTVGDSRQDPDPSKVDPSVKARNSSQGLAIPGNCPAPGGITIPNSTLSGQDCKWLQNTTAWSRMMRGIQSQKANLLFFNGDMIMGYGWAKEPASNAVNDVVKSDLMQFYQQYGFWRGMAANLMETGTYVVPVPGNHETQCKSCGKKAKVENENAWRDNMADLILDAGRMKFLLGSDPQNFDANNNPFNSTTSPNPDGITTDQKQLSFSFDIGDAHFAVINTDPVGKDGHPPTHWLEKDLTDAETRGARHIFVFGHKPAYFYNYQGAAPDASSAMINTDGAADAFWNVIVKHKATYFCGHEHIFNVKSYSAPDTTITGSALQVLVGTGGSPFESSVATGTPNDRMYAWATVKIFQSGKITLDTYGFDDTLTNPIMKLNNTSYLLP